MNRIITLTMNPSIDVSSSVSRVIPENKLRCSSPQYDPGGGGINVSRTIARLKGDSKAVFISGGECGNILKHLLEKEQICFEAIPVQNKIRENYVFMDETTKQQYRFNVPGPPLGDSEVKRILDTLAEINENPEYLILSGSLPHGSPEDFYKKVIRIFKKSRIILDTSGNALKESIKESIFLVKPNLRELSQLSEKEIENEDELIGSAQAVLKRFSCEYIIVSLGRGGAILFDKNGFNFFRAPIVPIKSKVGAGDCMVGGIVKGLSEGKKLEDALVLGIAAGSAAVMSEGSKLCSYDNTMELYKGLLRRRTS